MASFRARLVVAQTAALSVALVVLAGIVWLFAFALLNYNARVLLIAEIDDVLPLIVTDDGLLDPEGYTWDEPHHRFEGPHVDPYYLQVFDADGVLLRASDNIAYFWPYSYPDLVLAAPPDDGRLIQALQTFRADDFLLYYMTRPVMRPSGETIGFVQVARREPGIGNQLRTIALFLLAGLLVTLTGLSWITWWVGGRVLRPLAAITSSARRISPEDLNQRIPIPAGSDAETAQLAGTLNVLLERLESSFDEMRRFTANAAHELQTPLTVLLGHVEVALRRPRDPEAYRETLGLLRGEIEQLIRLVHGLLLLARIESEGRQVPLEPVDPGRLLQEEADRLRPRLDGTAVCLSVDDRGSVGALANSELLREVLFNLLDNAAKFTPAGEISANCYHADGLSVIEVRDTGIGIQPAAVARVTERFFRDGAAQAMGIPGSGLGLSLVDEIVTRMGGDVQIVSAPGGGTLVRVRLPAARAQS
jgi:signal transduction histidine kinase